MVGRKFLTGPGGRLVFGLQGGAGGGLFTPFAVFMALVLAVLLWVLYRCFEVCGVGELTIGVVGEQS